MVAASMRVSKGEHRGTPPPREVPLGAPHRGYVLVNYRDSRAVSGSGNRRSWCRLQPVVSAAHCAGRLLAPPPSGRQQQSRGVGGRTKSADVPRVLARFSVAFQPTKPMRSSRHTPRAVVAACLNDRPSVEQEYQQSSLVFVGHVTATSAVPATASFYEGSPYTIRVKEIFRGRPGHTVTVFSENRSGRFPVDVGGDYLIFLTRRTGELAMVNSCGNSGKPSDAALATSIVRQLSRRSR